jgi:ribose transport system substrate-binding protein
MLLIQMVTHFRRRDMDDRHRSASPMRRVMSGRRCWSLALAAGAALAIAACGSSSNGNSTSSPSATASPTTSASASTSTCMAEAKKVVDTASAPMTIEAPSQSIDMGKLKGKIVYFIGIGSGYSQRLADGFAAAARAAGLQPVIVSGTSVEQWNTAIQQATARHAGGIMIDVVIPSLVATSVAQAKAAGIPTMTSDSVPPPMVGMAANVLIRTDTGAPDAAQAALDTNCKVNAIISYDPSQVGLVAIGNSMKAELHTLCPTTCTTHDMPISLTTMSTAAGPALQTALARTPGINAVMPTFDSLGLLFEPAIAQSGSKAKLYSEDGDTPNLAMVAKGVQGADYSFAPTSYQGYIDLDTLARTMLKVKATPPPVQFQLFTAANIPKSTSFAAQWPQLVGFQSRFLKLWGLS